MKSFLGFLAIFFVILTLTLGFPYFINWLVIKSCTYDISKIDWSKSGTFGDTYGALNAFFSGLALFGLIYTIYLQITQLNIQRQELKASKDESVMNRATDILYNQLEKINQEVQSVDFEMDDESGSGLKAFDILFKLFKNHNEQKKEFLDKKRNLPTDKDSDGFPKDQELKIFLGTTTLSAAIIISDHSKTIKRYISSISSSIYVLKEIITRKDLNADQVKELRNLFFLNIGQLQLSTLKLINDEISFFKENDYTFPLFFKKLYDDTSFYDNEVKSVFTIGDIISTILQFYSEDLTEENLALLKRLWKSELQNQHLSNL